MVKYQRDHILRFKVLADNIRTAALITLGCRVNQYETDVISENLRERGFTIVPFGTPADVTVINTCTVTGESDRKSRQAIRRAVAVSPGAPIIVTGCYAETGKEAVSIIPGVTCVIGNGRKSHVPDIAESLLSGDGVGPVMDDGREMVLRSPQRTRSYIKIEDGCNNRCSYCIIPRARGRVRSKALSDIICEGRALREGGCREVILTGIETASYGLDLDVHDRYFGESLAGVIESLADIGFERIGLASLEPTVMNDGFIGRIARIPSLLPHFHLSVQSGSTTVLNRMRRRYNTKMLEEGMMRMREAVPEATFSADIITGFPGESDAEFSETVDFARRGRFMHLHIFPYSKREGTEAAQMPDQVSQQVKRERLRELSCVQSEIKRSLLNEYVGHHMKRAVHVLVESVSDGIGVGHSEHYAEVRFETHRAEVGDIACVRLTGHDGEICFGCDESSPSDISERKY